MSTNRKFDIGVLGATGFTGKLVCRYLANTYHGQIKWVMAGRSQSKLDQVKVNLAEGNSAAKDVPTLLVDVGDAESVRRLAASCRVVLNTVGPYSKYGDVVVDACIQEGTHYCDITGEVTWVRKNILTKHDAAAAKDVKIVHMCGNDSIPSDTAVWVAARELKEVHKQSVGRTHTVILKARGGFSGGTFGTVMNEISSVPSDQQKEAAKPYALNPPGSVEGPDKGEQTLPAYIPELNKYTMLWPLAAPDARVVRRSSALLGNLYGPNFSFDESIAVPGLLSAWLLTVALFGFFMCLTIPPLRWLLAHFLPKPGEGPSQELMDNGMLTAITVAYGDAKEGEKPAEVRVKFGLKGADQGYKGTGMMVTEAAMCLLEGACKQFGGAAQLKGGVLTPASAFGGALVDRLNNVPNFMVKVEKSEEV